MSTGRPCNILITGTPGTGKTILAKEVVERSSLSYISVNDLAKEGELYDGFDEENECHVLDEDRVLDEMEDMMSAGGQVVLDEARESYDNNIVHELYSNNLDDLEDNVGRICQWIKQWNADNN